MDNNILSIRFPDGERFVESEPLHQWDYGIKVVIENVDLPSVYEVHFSNLRFDGTSKTVIGSPDGFVIPQEYLESGRDIQAYIYTHATEDDGETYYHISIPVIKRAKPTDEEPAPTEQSTVEALIARTTQVVSDAESAINNIPNVVDNAIANSVDKTLTISDKPADAKAVGDELNNLKSDLGDLSDTVENFESISDEVKQALLACFAKVAWIGQDGQSYYDALETALYAKTPVVKISVTNKTAYGRILATDENYYARLNSNLTARCSFAPVQNKRNIINVVDASKYSVAIYDLVNNELVNFDEDYEQQITTSQGYLMSTSIAPTYVKSVRASGGYFACAFRKDSGADFTIDEINNADGTVFVVGKQSDLIIWDGNDSTGTAKWVDKNTIIGVSNPAKLAFVNGYAVAGAISSRSSAFPQLSTNRATSLSQAIVGDFDGKRIGLSNYELSSGSHVNYAIWYGYIDPTDRTYNGTQYISEDNIYTARQWLSDSVVLPTDDTKEGKRIILITFKIADADREFSQAELREIPTLINIA